MRAGRPRDNLRPRDADRRGGGCGRDVPHAGQTAPRRSRAPSSEASVRPARRAPLLTLCLPTRKEEEIPRYVIERTLPDGLQIPAGAEGAELCLAVVERNADEGVTWVHSYVSEDRKKTFCVYDGPSPEAIRKTAARNDLPVDRITQVRVLDPYFYE